MAETARLHHWWGASLALLAAAMTAVVAGLIGIYAYVNFTTDVVNRLWLPHLAPAAVLALALLGLAGALVIQRGSSTKTERGWLVAAHIIGPTAMLFTVPLLCLGRLTFRGGQTFTPGLAMLTIALAALALFAVVMLCGQQLSRQRRGYRLRLAWLMGMDIVCVLSFAATAMAYMFVELPQ